MWLFISLGGYIILAAVALLDKIILNKEVKNPAVFTFYGTIFLLPIFLLAPLGAGNISGFNSWLAAVVSGFAFALALWALYIGYQKSEVSHVGPLVGAATPFFVFILDKLFLGANFSGRELWAGAFLIVGSLIVSFEKSAKHNGWHRGMWWGIMAGFLFALSHIAAKFLYNHYGFYGGLVWSRGFIGVFGLLLLFLPGVRAVLRRRSTRQIEEMIPYSATAAIVPPSRQLLIVFINRFLALVGVLLVQYAIAIGSVSVVNALNGFQYAVLIILVVLLSRFWPRVFHENYGPLEIIQEVIAVIFIAVGVGLLV